MNWDRLEGQWKQRRGKAVYHWGKMMNDELSAILGKNEELVGKLQEKHGIAKEEAKQQIELFKMQCAECCLRTAEQMKKTNNKLRDMQKALNKNKKLTQVTVKLKSSSKNNIDKTKQRKFKS